jgi:uncharacterized YigZ family protein
MRTLAGPASIDIEIKRSRFTAHAGRVDSLAETLAFFESVADPAATHNCWAWKFDDRYRFNDDGEPGGSAGKPIHAAIDGKGLSNAMVVVTRYYGGIKLGVGGLVRAYGGAAARAIDAAGIAEIQALAECVVEAGFDWTGQVYAALEACGAKKLREEFGSDGVSLRIEIPENEVQRLETLLRDTTRGEAGFRRSA